MTRFSFVLVALALTACAVGPAVDDTDATDSQDLTIRGRRICSWNVRRLGHQFDQRDKDIAATARIISSFCDVVAVQEVMQVAGGGSPGYDALLAQLGETWDGVKTEEARPNSSSPNSERYAFYVRKSAATFCSGWSGTRYLPDDEDVFIREPAWTCVKLTAYDKDLLLISYHAIYGSPIERKREVSALDDDLDNDDVADDLFRTVKKSREGADVIMVGDFNLTPPEMSQALPRYRDVMTGTGSTLNNDDAITDNLFDHVLVMPSDPVATQVFRPEVIDVRPRAKNGSFFGSISDHLPIRFVLGTGNQ